MAAHVTILPPRFLHGSESAALEGLEEICSSVEPFEAALGEVETFIPVTPTVFIRIGHAAQRLRELHGQLNRDGLACTEQWPYMPHMTIIKVPTEQQAQKAYLVARKRWTHFKGSRTIHVKELTFVREQAEYQWVDLAEVPLGPRLVSAPHR